MLKKRPGDALPEMRRWCPAALVDCTHRGEPGCAIRRAAEGGEISLRRYQNYENR
jgi:putative ribosome biogenesis GTPase RsgA